MKWISGKWRSIKTGKYYQQECMNKYLGFWSGRGERDSGMLNLDWIRINSELERTLQKKPTGNLK